MQTTWFIRPDIRKDWPSLGNVAVIAYLVVLSLHLQGLGPWSQPEYMVDGEYIMGTHDAYHWLAGAEDFGRAAGKPLSVLAKWGSRITGASIGNVGFFAAALLASLVAVATALWAWTLGGLEAGLCAGTLAALAPGYYYRTRLGYYDTDVISLLFPLLIGWALAQWFQPYLAEGWRAVSFRAQAGEKGDAPPVRGRDLALLGLIGLAARFSVAWHADIGTFNMLAFCMSLGLALLLARPGLRPDLLWGLGLFGLTTFWGWPGLAAAAVVIFAWVKRPRWMNPARRTVWAPLVLTLAIAAQMGLFPALWSRAENVVMGYLKPVAQESATNETGSVPDPVIYPDIAQSIIEAQNLSWMDLSMRLHPWEAVSLLGLLGFGVVVAMRPTALFLAPFLMLFISSVKLGTRMSMFGGAPVALGVALPLCWAGNRLLRDKSWRRAGLAGLLAALTLLLVWPYIYGRYSSYLRLSPTPVLSRAHCMALERMRDKSPADSVIWTWWDWGYAANYYALRKTFADGGRHSGEYVFTLGLVLTTDNPLQASQLIKFSALHDLKPWEVWSEQSAAEVNDFLARLGKEDMGYQPKAKQYLVVAEENVRIASWINFYGSWDVRSGQGVHSKLFSLDEAFTVNAKEGSVTMQGDDRAIKVSTIDSLSDKGVESKSFPDNGGPHLFLFPDKREYLVLDDLSYYSVMVQLLVGDPESPAIARHFRLVDQDLPWVRIYEVL